MEGQLEGKFTVHLVDLKHFETGRTRCGLETLPEGHEARADVTEFLEGVGLFDFLPCFNLALLS